MVLCCWESIVWSAVASLVRLTAPAAAVLPILALCSFWSGKFSDANTFCSSPCLLPPPRPYRALVSSVPLVPRIYPSPPPSPSANCAPSLNILSSDSACWMQSSVLRALPIPLDVLAIIFWPFVVPGAPWLP